MASSSAICRNFSAALPGISRVTYWPGAASTAARATDPPLHGRAGFSRTGPALSQAHGTFGHVSLGMQT